MLCNTLSHEALSRRWWCHGNSCWSLLCWPVNVNYQIGSSSPGVNGFECFWRMFWECPKIIKNDLMTHVWSCKKLVVHFVHFFHCVFSFFSPIAVLFSSLLLWTVLIPRPHHVVIIGFSYGDAISFVLFSPYLCSFQHLFLSEQFSQLLTIASDL